ncbi:MAG: polysaccharide deacetylase family protein [Pseudomonadota bacterium]
MHWPLSILIYHRVLAHADPLFPDQIDARRFDSQMRTLGANFTVLPLAQAVQALRERTLPRRAACITFDDGYADNAQVALPILLRHRLPATFFIASGFLRGATMWNDAVIARVRGASGGILNLTRFGLGRHDISSMAARRATIDTLLAQLKYLPAAQRDECVKAIAPKPARSLMMIPDQVLALHRSGMDIGAHTVSHPILATLGSAAARREIAQGRHALEDITGAPVKTFAYPNGKPGVDFAPEHVEMVRALGFDAAVTTAWGSARAGADPFRLPRFTPWDRSSALFSLRLAANLLRRPA